jgi:hypothetical protein
VLQGSCAHTPSVDFVLKEGALPVSIHGVHCRGEVLADGSHDQFWLAMLRNH